MLKISFTAFILVNRKHMYKCIAMNDLRCLFLYDFLFQSITFLYSVYALSLDCVICFYFQ